eukprot:CAMPEP_0197555604 /NCGR_PEP_ID=MMETSP1320-20131121/13588_1 /TAXON_ID=91990 /ORGANISM="Bolidomonas sp., Strain RCC2347" /LENGTH=45 /DNA_ID= /DNA_START= /DNA_END= /DNA_ORIENTATION=
MTWAAMMPRDTMRAGLWSYEVGSFPAAILKAAMVITWSEKQNDLR